MSKFTITSYDHAGIALNVAGHRDEDECTITRVTAADSNIDIFDLFRPSELERMAECIEARLEREAAAARAEARVERHQWHREFSLSAAA